MARKTACLFRGRISEREFRDLLRLFAFDIAAERAGELAGPSHDTALALYRLLRQRMAGLAVADCPFKGRAEVDQSYFGPTRSRDRKGRGNPRRVPVLGILERGGRVQCRIVGNCAELPLQAIIEGRVAVSSGITSDGFASYDGSVEAGASKHHRIDKHRQRDRPVFAENGVHGPGDPETVQRPASREGRHRALPELRQTAAPDVQRPVPQQLPRSAMAPLLKETGFRFDNRRKDPYGVFLGSGRSQLAQAPDRNRPCWKIPHGDRHVVSMAG